MERRNSSSVEAIDDSETVCYESGTDTVSLPSDDDDYFAMAHLTQHAPFLRILPGSIRGSVYLDSQVIARFDFDFPTLRLCLRFLMAVEDVFGSMFEED